MPSRVIDNYLMCHLSNMGRLDRHQNSETIKSYTSTLVYVGWRCLKNYRMPN